ncbi:MAG: DUF3368 domain-containing protein [Chloroflexi bacterium]|nr:DUF3368 domain-containing protein [Chloroflexota bacterium]
MIALLDNTVLSNFALVNRPDLIRRALGRSAATVQEVYQELQAGVRLGKVPDYDWSWLPILQLDETEQAMYESLRERLNSGEAACLAVAANRGYAVFTDDRDARESAMQMQVPISGTLGLLVLSIEKGHISLSEGNSLLKAMIQTGYRSPVNNLTVLL